MSYKANEWQEFSLKKDIEAIYRKLNSREKYDICAILELCITLASFIIDYVSSPCNKFWNVVSNGLLVCSLIPIILIVYFWIIEHIKDKNKSYNNISVKNAVDKFDNEICYYLMIAESYLKMLNDNDQKEFNTFYYIEVYYYINKVKFLLSNMYYNISDIFTETSKVAMSRNKISLYRVKNVINIITSLEESLKTQSANIDDLEKINTMNTEYNDLYKIFVDTLDEKFK